MQKTLLCTLLVGIAYSQAGGFAQIGFFPGYTGASRVGGTVVVTGGKTPEDTLTLTYALTGLTATDGNMAIYEGDNCRTAAGVGSSYWKKSAGVVEPWNTLRWRSAKNYKGVLKIDKVGYSVDTIINKRVIVVHDQAGAKIGCGKITDGSEHYAVINPGQNALGNVVVSELAGAEGTVVLNYSLTGLQYRSGSIRIHEGTRCDQVGGNYYDKETYPAADPWRHIEWSWWDLAAGGTARDTKQCASGISFEKNIGHTVVVNDFGSDEVTAGCGVIASKANVQKAFDTTFDTQGVVRVYPKNATTMTVSYSFTGADSRGIGHVRVHTGTSCTEVGSHYFQDMGDPWTYANCPVDVQLPQGETSTHGAAIGSFDIAYGYTIEETMGHVMVVYDSEGKRVSCGVLSGAAVPTAAPVPTAAAPVPTAAPPPPPPTLAPSTDVPTAEPVSSTLTPTAATTTAPPTAGEEVSSTLTPTAATTTAPPTAGEEVSSTRAPTPASPTAAEEGETSSVSTLTPAHAFLVLLVGAAALV